MNDFADFEIWVGTGSPSTGGNETTFPVHVISSPEGPASSELKLDLSKADFKTNLTLVRSVDPNLPLRQSFGEQLFTALFGGDVLETWRASWGRVNGGAAEGLRLLLWFESPELAALPWELLWDPHDKVFLATTANAAVSRYLPVPEPPLLSAHERLDILVVVESPPGPPAVTAEEVTRLEDAIKNLGNKVEYKILRNANTSEIQNELQKGYQVLHYLGHGRSGQLILTDDVGQPKAIDDLAFAQLFKGRRSLRLVVLNACDSSQPEEGGLFAGMGPALVQARVSAVVAMQYKFVQLETAGQFSRAFYGALANGLAVDVAVNEARMAISAGPLLDSRDWSTPVLYMGTRTGHILNLKSAEATEVDRAWQELRTAAGESQKTKTALADLSQRFQQLAEANRRMKGLMQIARYLGDLKIDFDHAQRIVEEANRSPARLEFAEFSRVWKNLSQNRIQPIQVLIEKNQETELKTRLAPLMRQSQAVDSDIVQEARRSLANTTVSTFGDELARSETYIREQLEKTIDDLLALSERTLGHLTAT